MDQPILNIGTIGHVSNGKTSLIEALTGIDTRKHSKEKIRGITIKLGHASCKIYYCEKCDYYQTNNHFCQFCNKDISIQRYVSFTDCPGHESLMNTMLNGSSTMDGALLLIAGNKKFPQPQTVEHLKVMDILKIKNIIIVQNKIDLVTEKEAIAQYEDIKEYFKNTDYKNSPIIPISANLNINIDIIMKNICEEISLPKRNLTSSPYFTIIRSFNINRQNCEIDDIRGGVLGGILTKGIIRVNDEIEIKPGIVEKKEDGILCTPILSKVISIKSENHNLQEAYPGCLIGIETNIDPQLTMDDRMVGQVVSIKNKLPDIINKIKLKFILFENQKKLSKGDIIHINIHSNYVKCKIVSIKNDILKLSLHTPICLDKGENVTLLRDNRLTGYGEVL